MRNENILVIDHDAAFRQKTWQALQSTDIFIYQSDSIEKTMDIMSRVSFDLFLLNVSLKGDQDGFYLAQIIREQKPLVPILFLSEKKDRASIIAGLEAGADLYLTKPIDSQVLKTQILTSLKRAKTISHKQDIKENIEVGDFLFDRRRYQLFKNGCQIELSSKEMQLLQFFLQNPEQVFSKEQIYASVWNTGEMDTNTIMVFINHLRSKIEDDPKKARYLKTIWGIGYMFVPSGD